jgi:hypothetical protein
VGPGRRAASSVPVVRRTGRRASSRALSTTRLTDRREPAGERSKRGVLEGVRAGGSDLRTGRGPGSAGARRGKRDRGQRGQQPLRYTASQAKRASASAATSLHLWRRPTKARRERERGRRARPQPGGAMRTRWEDRTGGTHSRAPAPPAPGGPLGAVLPFNRTTCENSRDRTPHASPTRYYDTHDSMLRRTIQYTR